MRRATVPDRLLYVFYSQLAPNFQTFIPALNFFTYTFTLLLGFFPRRTICFVFFPPECSASCFFVVLELPRWFDSTCLAIGDLPRENRRFVSHLPSIWFLFPFFLSSCEILSSLSPQSFPRQTRTNFSEGYLGLQSPWFSQIRGVRGRSRSTYRISMISRM